MSKETNSTPSLLAETFMSVLKFFVIVVILNNIVWTIFFFKPTTPRVGDTHVEITQSGNHDIKQNIKN